MIRRAKPVAIAMLLFLLLLGGCASTKEAEPLAGEQLHRRLVTTLVEAAYGLDTRSIMAKSVEELLPDSALPMSLITGIPLFAEQLSRFKDEVNGAFLFTAWEIAPLLEPVITEISWSDDRALASSLRSGAATLRREQRDELLALITPILAEALKPAMNRWTALIDWYHLYRESIKLLKIEELPLPDADIEGHLTLLYLDRYCTALGDEEERLRSPKTEVR
ncbi:MAG: DUF4197 domain-containing protein [Spirochaetales bacterium]|nr:DUF4197 domain-containing protein [Spirochaetales bacterium]